MGTITGETSLNTRWLLDLDVQAIVETAQKAVKSPDALGTILFIGETHKIGFDVDRRTAVYGEFAGDDRVVILLERGMDHIRMGNVLQENNKFDSEADERNNQVVTYLKEELDSSSYNKPVIVFFGQEHENKLKEHMKKQFPQQVRLRWVSAPTIGDYIEKEPATPFDPAGKIPAGYVECNQQRLDHRLGLLKKGIVHEPFNLELSRRDAVFEALVWAIYFTDPATNARIRRDVQEQGSSYESIVRINGVSAAFARLILRMHVPRAENGTLTDAHLCNEYF